MRSVQIVDTPEPDSSVSRMFLCGTFPKPKTCIECGEEETEFLCDARITVRHSRKSLSKTCDLAICADCTRKRGSALDFCSRHADQADGFHTGTLL